MANELKRAICLHAWGHYGVYIIITDKMTETSKRLIVENHIKDDVTSEYTTAVTLDCNDHSIVALPHDCDAGTVAHECFHAVDNLLKFTHVYDETGEVTAYHLEYLVNEATATLTKWEKKYDRGRGSTKSVGSRNRRGGVAPEPTLPTDSEVRVGKTSPA